MPKVLIDTTLITHSNTGLGNVMQALAQGFNAQPPAPISYNLLVPQGYPIPPSATANFIPVHKWQKYLRFTLPKVDVWHSTYQSFRYLRKTGNTQQVLTIHDLNFLYEKNAIKSKFHLRKLQARINRADAITTISQFVAKDIQENLALHGKPVDVIYNSVENLQQRAATKPVFCTGDAPFFFTLGAVRRKKNLHSLLGVMARFPDYNLYISGNLDDPDYLAQLHSDIAKLGLTNVFITGPIRSEEKIWLYQNAHAFLFPSLFEGFGLPVVEAMQFGTPVFTSNMTSLPEVGGGHTIIWDNFDPEHMAEAILRHLPGLRQDTHKRAAMQAYATSFSLEKNIQQYSSLYKRLVGNTPIEN